VAATSEARNRRWEATHQRIYDVAIELFLRDGFENVSVGQIAKGAKVSVPTFYAHYSSKEHLVMRPPTVEEISALMATQPASVPISDRLRKAIPLWFADWTPEFRQAQLVRWQLIASTPSLRTRAAEFERASAEMVAKALPAEPGATLTPAELMLISAQLVAYTFALLAWAEGNGERKLEELIEESFDSLHGIARQPES
jgi:AcrR family transcriptional regulator